MILSGIAPSIYALIAFRCLSGIGGGSVEVGNAYITDCTNKQERPRYLSLQQAVVR